MWFSLDPPERPRRRGRPSHATIVAYLALIVAVAGGTGAAVAATVIHTRNIADGAVTNPKIANDAVGNAKLRNDSVGNAKLRNDSVGNAKLRNDSVGNAKLRNHAVGPAKMRTAAVNHRILSNDSVGTNNLMPKSVSNTKIQRGAVRSFQVKNRSLTGRDVKNKSLTGRQIAAHTITGDNVKDHSLTGKQIDVSTLPLTGVAEHFTGTAVTIDSTFVPIPLDDPTGLGPGVYSQPAHSLDIVAGHFSVDLPATNCVAGGPVLFIVYVDANGRLAAAGTITLPESNGLVGWRAPIADADPTPTTNTTSGPETRTLTARVVARCINTAGNFAAPSGATVHDLSLYVTRSRGAVPASGVGGG